MNELAYVSEVRIEREGGPVRRAFLPGQEEPVMYGAHGAVREHYGYADGQFPESATTLRDTPGGGSAGTGRRQASVGG